MYQCIRLGRWLSLIFFVYSGTGCKQATPEEVGLVWSEKQATGIIIPGSLVENREEAIKDLQVFLQTSKTPMLGEYATAKEGIRFSPLIPLSPGKQYEVFFKKKQIGRLSVPLPDTADAPRVVALYPSNDTLPGNLLKIYLLFSSPMREGEALRHIYLLDERTDTIPDVFLDLQPELWNEERTALTVWLDPGRIKRGLIPNQRLGNPLKAGARYTVVVNDSWKNGSGLPLKQVFTKSFFVAGRDDASPQPGQWQMRLPSAGTLQPLQIEFNEPLDLFLVQETLQVVNKQGTIQGRITLTNKETGCSFQPAHPWQAGRYRLQVAAYLEDLAGNNLNKLFDRDVTRQPKKEEAVAERAFVIVP